MVKIAADHPAHLAFSLTNRAERSTPVKIEVPAQERSDDDASAFAVTLSEEAKVLLQTEKSST